MKKKSKPAKKTTFSRIVFILPMAFLIIFYVIPILIMMVYSFWELDFYGNIVPAWNLNQYKVFFENAVYSQLLLKSLKTAALNCILCLLIAYPLAYFIAKKVPKRMQYPLLFLTLLPSWTSFLIRTYSWILMLGETGVFNYFFKVWGIVDEPLTMAFTPGAVLVSLVQIYLPYMVLPLFNSIEKIDQNLMDASDCLGASKAQTFYHIVFRLSLPGIAAGCITVLIPSIGEYVVPMIIGGNSGMMYSNAVTSQFTITNWPLGAALAFILMLVIIILFVLYSRIMKIEDLWSAL